MNREHLFAIGIYSAMAILVGLAVLLVLAVSHGLPTDLYGPYSPYGPYGGLASPLAKTHFRLFGVFGLASLFAGLLLVAMPNARLRIADVGAVLITAGTVVSLLAVI